MPSPLPLRVLICADHQLVRTGIRAMLADQKWIDVVAEVGSGWAAIENLRSVTPDLVVMDFTPPITTAVETLCGFRGTDTPVVGRAPAGLVAVSTVDDDLLMIARRFGADIVLAGPVTADMLVDAITTCADRRRDHLSHPREDRSNGGARAAGSAPTAPDRRPVSGLTPREREILGCVARGLTNAEIGGRLVLSEATVKTHITRILTKTGARHRAEAVVVAFRCGLGDLGGPASSPPADWRTPNGAVP
jgi:DNA-binding NarL/FixJ family response regulator